MTKTKKTVLIAVAAVLIIAVGGLFLWGYYHPTIDIGVSRPTDTETEMYYEVPTIIYSTFFGIPLCPDAEKMLQQYEDFNAVFFADIMNIYQKPMHITVDITEQNGKTIVNYSGWVTNTDGNRADYFRSAELEWKFNSIQ